MAETESATVSPDGKNVYVGSYSFSGASLSEGFAVFARNTSTGALTQLAGTAGCLTPDGSSNAGAGTCTKARGVFDSMGDGHDLVFTSNGRWAYMAANGFGANSGLLIFRRDPRRGPSPNSRAPQAASRRPARTRTEQDTARPTRTSSTRAA